MTRHPSFLGGLVLFQVFDLDGSGTIDTEELRKIVKATNMASEKQLDRKVRSRAVRILSLSANVLRAPCRRHCCR